MLINAMTEIIGSIWNLSGYTSYLAYYFYYKGNENKKMAINAFAPEGKTPKIYRLPKGGKPGR